MHMAIASNPPRGVDSPNIGIKGCSKVSLMSYVLDSIIHFSLSLPLFRTEIRQFFLINPSVLLPFAQLIFVMPDRVIDGVKFVESGMGEALII